MAYVDLNLIHANSPKTADHASIKQRINKAQQAPLPNHPEQQPPTLMPLSGYPREDMPKGLPLRLTDYLELVDWTGRVIRDDKRGHIDSQLSPILTRLNMDPKHWCYLTQHFESKFKGLVGSAHQLKQACQILGYQRTPGIKNCQAYFPEPYHPSAGIHPTNQ